MNINDAIEYILSGNCVLFTGAGFSFNSKNIENREPQGARALANYLYEESDFDEGDSNLTNASEIYVDTHGELRLIELLKREYNIVEISEDQAFIASLPWKRIYTTNYDNIIEIGYKRSRRLITPVVLNDKINHYKDKRTLAIHLNGYIDRLTPPALYNEFKLTETSYLTTSDFVSSSWIDLFRNDLVSSGIILFIGFSLTGDLELKKIISTLSNRDNIFFVVAKFESKLNIIRLEKFGTVLPIGLEGIVSIIKEIQKDYIPKENVVMNFNSFREVKGDYNLPTLKDIDMFDLLFKGTINEPLVHFSINSPEKFPYFIKRKESEDILNYIREGGRNILLHSGLGNGKSLFLEGVSHLLTNEGYRVFFFQKYFEHTDQEIEKLMTLNGKTVLIVESYHSHFELLKKINLFRTNDTIVIVTERSMINDTVYNSLEEHIFNETYLTRDLNQLNIQEVSILIDMLNHYGYWGKYSEYSLDRKRKLITDDCKLSFRLLLLTLIDSSDIKARFNDLLERIKDINESFFEAALLILSSKLFDFKLDLDDLVDILDDDLLNNPAFHNNDQLKEIIDFTNYNIKARSAILAEALLVNNKFNLELISLLIKVVKKLDPRRYDKNNYVILKSIVSFSRLQSIFNLNENIKFKPVILNFFEEIKNTNYAKKNHFFWLQYAIARLSTRDYEISEKYFQTAYSYAKKISDFDTFQIDNHYARHMLENEIYNGEIETCMDQFLKVHNILSNKSDMNLNRHYPFRVAVNYGKFYTRFYKDLKSQDKKIFLVSCDEILRQIKTYKETVKKDRWNKSVTICEDKLEHILNKEDAKKLN